MYVRKTVGVLAFAILATTTGAAAGQAGAPTSKAEQFRDTETRFQQQSRNASPSPPVDTSTPASDPIPKAKTPQEKTARFNYEEQRFQAESTNLPSASPRVSKTTAAASPYPKATTKEQKKARFTEEERVLQQQSKP